MRNLTAADHKRSIARPSGDAGIPRMHRSRVPEPRDVQADLRRFDHRIERGRAGSQKEIHRSRTESALRRWRCRMAGRLLSLFTAGCERVKYGRKGYTRRDNRHNLLGNAFEIEGPRK